VQFGCSLCKVLNMDMTILAPSMISLLVKHKLQNEGSRGLKTPVACGNATWQVSYNPESLRKAMVAKGRQEKSLEDLLESLESP
jgi:hypothetical protein